MSRRRRPMDLHTVAYLIVAGGVLAAVALVVTVVVMLASAGQR